MYGLKFALLVAMVIVIVGVYGQNDDKSCPPEWSFVHQCWKTFEERYKQFTNETALNVRQNEVEQMCSCMAKAVTQVVSNALLEVEALK